MNPIIKFIVIGCIKRLLDQESRCCLCEIMVVSYQRENASVVQKILLYGHAKYRVRKNITYHILKKDRVVLKVSSKFDQEKPKAQDTDNVVLNKNRYPTF